MFLGSPRRAAQKAIETVIESPKVAKVPGVPVKRARTFFMGSTHEGLAASGGAASVALPGRIRTAKKTRARLRSKVRFIVLSPAHPMECSITSLEDRVNNRASCVA